MTIRRRFATLATLVVALLAFGAAAPAAAEGLPTNTTFVTDTNQEVGFGSAWFVTIQVRQKEYFSPLDSTDGTVDVFAEGIAEPLGDDLPLTRDGIAFFAQPADRPLLAAGTYVLSATFTPAAGTSTLTSRTTTPTTLTITPLAVSTSFDVIDDPSRYAEPTVEARVGGDYVDVTGRAPSGDWSVVVTDGSGAEVFTDSVAQAADAALPTAIPLTSGIKPGTTYSVAATFTPAEGIAGGLEVGVAEPQKLQTAPAGVLDGAVAPVSLPWWAIIALIVLVALLAAAVVLLLVIGSRRGASTLVDAPNAEQPADAEMPLFVDEQPAFVDDEHPAFVMDDLPRTGPQISVPPSEDRKSWSLGDDRG